MSKIELLAPAGDLKRLKTAIRYGADAVYIGGKELSLRSRASNFSIEEIAEGVRFANEYGAKVYVTVNMIPHDEDFVNVKEYLISLQQAGVDAIICASLHIMKLCKEVAPKMEVHVSTQQTSTNSLTVDYWKMLGADRVVLAREVTLEQMRKVAKHSSLPLEVFIHGGMCVNYSGRCTLSNQMTLRDANRGGCAQSCRWKYRIYNEQNEPIHDEDCLFSMSSKDLQAASVIGELMDMGISSLKIEGRMKTAYYIATVVKAYRNLIDTYQANGVIAQQQLEAFQMELAKAENRPASSGFYYGLPQAKDHLYGVNGAGVIQDFVATVVNYDEITQVATIQVRNHFTVPCEMELLSPYCDYKSFTIEHLTTMDGNEVTVANQPMQLLNTKIPFAVAKEDMIRKKQREVVK
ncbi:MAG: U32 family peptidase [Erysipelotrichaceae bacterium]|nr:U32 family peptidase [Erysipelotrichaceae bacterium]